MPGTDQLIVLGIDGLDWEYVDAHRADLPTLASWPALVPLRSVLPPDSIPAWTTIFTGRPPGEHGLLDSIDYLDRRPAAAADSAGRSLPGQTFWDAASRDGHRVVVVNPFLAYPAWDVEGVMVSGPVFVSGEVSVTGAAIEDLGPLPELGGIVTFPTERSMGPFVSETLWATREQSDFGLRLLDAYGPDLFFLTLLTIDRIQHFAWRFSDPGDPTYPGPNPYEGSVLQAYRLIDEIAGDYAERGRVVLLSDHGHGRRATRMVYVDEALRRAGLVDESRRGPRALSRAFLLERAKRAVLAGSYRFSLEEPAYQIARRLPHRRALRDSTFSSDGSSPARASRTFGRNQHGGVELRDDSPELRARVRDLLLGLVDPETGEGVVDWVRDREDLVGGAAVDRFPPVLFALREGYGVDWGLYGPVFGPNVNHRRVSGGHKEDGVLACSYPVEDPPADLAGVHDFVLREL
jgi:predicted AlkP superfamily phosphohydrolase/phosphomutase